MSRFTAPAVVAATATLLAASGGALVGAGAARAQPDAGWVARMDALAVALSQLLPDALGDPPSSAEQQEARDERLRKNTRALATLAHDLRMVDPSRLPDNDPTVPLLARELDSAMADVETARGDRLKDASLLVASTCIACHTRTNAGAPRPRMRLPAVDPSLPAWVQADVLAATRRFEPARAAYRAVIRDESFAEKEPMLWEHAVKRALVLEVRTARDPRGALEIVEQVLHTPALEGREGMLRDAAGWRTSLRAWAAEPQRPRTRQALYAQAQRLMDQANALARAPDDSSADILYLRTTSALHELLSKLPADAKAKGVRAQALSWLGESYEALRDVDVWSLYLLYDEACIEEAPHSIIAGECYDRLVRATRVEESGNGGAPLDAVTRARLERLKDLSVSHPR